MPRLAQCSMRWAFSWLLTLVLWNLVHRARAEAPWTEYPRPLLERSHWRSLNGAWQYAITPRSQRHAPTWEGTHTGTIRVPFAIEAALSGVQRMLDPDEALWYRRRVAIPADLTARRIFVNFEACDYACNVSLDGVPVGHHVGGNTPFRVEITSAVLMRGDTTHTLEVRVEDATSGTQLRGKQSLLPGGIWYTRVSGIWQSVWFEALPTTHFEDLVVTTSPRAPSITVAPLLARGDDFSSAFVVEAAARDASGAVVATAREMAGAPLTLRLEPGSVTLWSVERPYLYTLRLRLLAPSRTEPLDEVKSYAGVREVGTSRDADGHLRFTLNHEPVFHWGPLDQGWWPDGLLTPPSDAALVSDIEFIKHAGFNMIRKHIKIEPRRFYWHCDRVGLLVWQDHVAGGFANDLSPTAIRRRCRGPTHKWICASENRPAEQPPESPPLPQWTRLAPNPEDGAWSAREHAQFMRELEEMVAALYSHPCIVVWVLYNEAWGQHDTVRAGEWLVARDPTRHVNAASGGNFFPVGHVADDHNYPRPNFTFDAERFDRDYVKVVGEFGGHGLAIKGHLGARRRNWGYGNDARTREELVEQYARSVHRLAMLKDQRGIAAGVYTQTSDVEGEINGLLTYDRQVAKIDPRVLRKIHARALGGVGGGIK